jgi:hypothetical protein
MLFLIGKRAGSTRSPKQERKHMRTALIAGLVVTALAFGVPGFAGDAKSHEEMAAQYAKDAESARAQADRHDKMGASYTGYAKEKLHLEDHCRAVANDYRSAAKELDTLAAGERELAKGDKK